MRRRVEAPQRAAASAASAPAWPAPIEIEAQFQDSREKAWDENGNSLKQVRVKEIRLDCPLPCELRSKALFNKFYMKAFCEK